MMNTMKTFLLMAALTALFMFVGQALGGRSGMMMAFFMALAMNFFAYWNSDKMALAMNGAREVGQHEAPELHALVAQLAQRFSPAVIQAMLDSLFRCRDRLLNVAAVNRELLKSGASISEMNCVRRHLSAIKGGRLAAACHPAKVVTLTISDVPGDDPSVIASGPTVPDASTCADALAILDRYQIGIPESVRAALQAGELETPKPGDARFEGHEVHLIATPQQSLEAAAAAARAAGIAVHVLSDEMEGESREVGKVHAALARAVARHEQPFARPCVILSGGETTVTIRPRQPGAAKGRGGRAGEFCLGLAQALQGQEKVWALAADTDGIDGVEDNAGARVSPCTLKRAAEQNLRISDHLDRNDAYGYFSALGDLVITGPTHTNVNDFRAILIL